MELYRIRREWKVTMESWVEIEAENLKSACEIALDVDDYDNQRIADCSDEGTIIGRVELAETGEELPLPDQFK
jgi:hypothetical protein